MPGHHLIRILSAAFVLLASTVHPVLAGGETTLDYVRDFLTRYPSFKAEGTMTSTLAGNKAPYRCRIEITFDSPQSMKFAYNTDAAKNIIPYDFVYSDRHLWETVYNRDRTETLSHTDIGAPNRTLFNFVSDLLGEALRGPGLKSLLFNGLMSIEQSESSARTQINLERRLPVIPVKTVSFTFDGDQRLRSIHIFLSDGSQHRVDIRRFRPVAPGTH